MENHGRHLLHQVDQISGIGPSLAKELARRGAPTLEELLALPLGATRQLAKTIRGLTLPGLLRLYRPQARFLLIKDMTPALAEALVKVGMFRLSDLVGISTDVLYSQLAKVIQDPPDISAICTLQLLAAREAFSGLLLLRVSSAKDGRALGGARMAVQAPGFLRSQAGVVRRADSGGWIVSPRLQRSRSHLIHIEAPGHQRQIISLRMPGGAVRVIRSALLEGVQTPDADEFRGEPLGLLPRSIFVVNEPGSITDFQPGTPFRIRKLHTDGSAVLSTLWRRRFGNEIRSYQVEVKTDVLPRSVEEGAMLLITESGHWARMSPTAIQQERQRRRNMTQKETSNNE